MPSRNVVKVYAPDNFYHVYNRGVAKQPVFMDSADKANFMAIIERHLNPDNHSVKSDGLPYRKFNDNVELVSYCLMGNHFHLLVYLKNEATTFGIFMQSVLTAYTMYFNKRHGRVGTLFQGVFKASRILNDTYLLHITRYIHMNPRTYRTYYYSSLREYLGKRETTWLSHSRVLSLFSGAGDYLTFLEDFVDYKATLDEVKRELVT